MREHKFRFWDSFNETYTYSEGKNLGHFFSLYEATKDGGNNPILEQFTGLKDKNGKEIYEGDVISVRTEFYNVHNEEQDHDKTYTGEVKLIPSRGMCLKNPKWYCWVSDTNGQDKNYKSFSAYKSEVIGNIHENKDLLK